MIEERKKWCDLVDVAMCWIWRAGFVIRESSLYGMCNHCVKVQIDKDVNAEPLKYPQGRNDGLFHRKDIHTVVPGE